jgi:hypothetical protein
MSWIQTNKNVNTWTFSSVTTATGTPIETTFSGLNRIVNANNTGTQSIEYRNNDPLFFNSDKTYLFKIDVLHATSSELKTISGNYRLSIITNKPAFNNENFITITPSFFVNRNGSRGFLELYIRPTTSASSNKIVTIGAEQNFSGLNLLEKIEVRELNFVVNGFRQYRNESIPTNIGLTFSGWYNNPTNTTNEKYIWEFYNITQTPTSAPRYLNIVHNINYIARKSEFENYNIEFKFNKESGSATDGINVYVADSSSIDNPKNTAIGTLVTTNRWKLLYSLTQSGTHSIYGINGRDSIGNRSYIVFSASQSNNFKCSLENFIILGGYSDQNNSQFLTTNSLDFTESTPLQILGGNSSTEFDFITGTGSKSITTTGTTISDNLKLINSKLGNGTFKAGIWENGIWNNGWRKDNDIFYFDDVDINISSYSDIEWKIRIKGPIDSVSNFKKGDIVSIGNIVAIDINEERKLLKDTYTIIDISSDSIIVDIATTFPFRRIEKDSPNHKIGITKNIWLSGAFLNGYFTGIWNNGWFKGSPMITEMFDTFWIDGIFDGGHFNSKYHEIIFNNVFSSSINNINYLGFNLQKDHSFNVGDVIEYKTVNQQYKSANIIKKEGLQLTIDVLYTNISGTGSVRETKASGLIQNFSFNDNNISKVTSVINKNSSSVFSFLSWIDVNYNKDYAVNINRSGKVFNRFTKRQMDLNTLYGYPTFDILSSSSNFRDSHTLNTREYKLGSKYRIFTDFLESSSEFKEPFNMEEKVKYYIDSNGEYASFSVPLIGLNPFVSAGWTFSGNLELSGSTNSSFESTAFKAKNTETQSISVYTITNNDNSANGIKFPLDDVLPNFDNGGYWTGNMYNVPENGQYRFTLSNFSATSSGSINNPFISILQSNSTTTVVGTYSLTLTLSNANNLYTLNQSDTIKVVTLSKNSKVYLLLTGGVSLSPNNTWNVSPNIQLEGIRIS